MTETLPSFPKRNPDVKVLVSPRMPGPVVELAPTSGCAEEEAQADERADRHVPIIISQI
jgi:hypothetical protein